MHERTKANMRESSSQVEVILENLTEGFFVVDREWRYTYVNRRALLRIQGAKSETLTREDLLGKSVWEVLPGQVGSVFYQKFHKAIREQKTVRFEAYLSPTKEWCEVHAKPSKEGLAVCLYDVTGRKRAEERFRATFEQAAVGIAHVSVDGRLLRVNGKLCETLGYTREELMNLNVGDVSYPEDHAADLEQVGRVLAGEKEAYAMEKRYVRKDGSPVWTNLSVSLVRNHCGEPEYFIGAIEDITERKRAEEALRKSEAHTRAIVETAMDAIITITGFGLIQSFNGTAERIFGYSAEETVGRDIRMLMPERFKAAHQAGFRRYLKTREARVVGKSPVELIGRRKDGVEFPLEFSLGEMREAGDVLFTGIIRDITERKRTEKALRKSEERFRAQYMGIPVPTFSWRKVGEDFELADYNDAADRLTQGKIGDLMGLKASEWYSDDPWIMETLSRCYNEGITIHQERSWRLSTTGEDKHLAVTLAYVPPDLVMAHVEDITERKRAEEAIKESHTLLRSIIDEAPDPIFLKDTNCRILLANSATAEALGCSVEKILGKDNTDLMPPETARRTMEVDRRVMETGESQTGEEIMTVRGVDRTYSFNKAPYRDHRGEVVGVIGIGRDITERKQAEAALRQTKERFHSLVQYSSNITTILAADGTGRYQSPAIEWILGYEPEELIGKNVFDFVHPEERDHVLDKFTHLLNNPETHPLVQFRFRHKDGSWRYLEAIGSNLLQDPGVAGVVFNSRDITERKKLEENQQRFFANAAHQLKTPLTTIVGATELLVIQQGLGTPKKIQLLDHIFSEALRMQRLSDNLLRLARIGHDRQDPELEAVDLTEAARQAAGRMTPLAESLGLSIRVEGDDARVLADPDWLQEALLILLSNAAKHTDPPGEIRLKARKNTIAVEDEGTGISSDDLTHVFERFYRGRGRTEGFGLGLSIAQELVERMDGSISIVSREGFGTRVEIELPDAGTNA